MLLRVEPIPFSVPEVESTSRRTGLHLPPGTRVKYGGSYATQQQPLASPVLVLAIMLILIIVLLFEFSVGTPTARLYARC